MSIDLRILIPIASPFCLLGLSRLMWWAAGAPWSEPAAAALACLIFGSLLGLMVALVLAEKEIEIGRIQIGRRREDRDV